MKGKILFELIFILGKKIFQNNYSLEINSISFRRAFN